MSLNRRLAVIGTAGRDSSITMTVGLWEAMVVDLQARLDPQDVLISGGAAWADHLAVHAYLSGWCSDLHLYLPAPIRNGFFQGPFKSAGEISRHYHQRFSRILGVDTQAQIVSAIAAGAVFEYEPQAAGVRAMFVRNAKVAKAANSVLAYTFGAGGTPLPGGTLDTWSQVSGPRLHVSLGDLQAGSQRCRQSDGRMAF